VYRWLKISSKALLAGIVVAVLMASTGCSTAKQTADDGDDAFRQQNWDAAVYHYLQALAEDPGNVEYKMQLTFARQKAAQMHFQRGITMRQLGRLNAARSELQMAMQLDPTNQYAEQILEDVIEEMEVLSMPEGARKLEQLKDSRRRHGRPKSSRRFSTLDRQSPSR
jgi:general secretion pathway protein D